MSAEKQWEDGRENQRRRKLGLSGSSKYYLSFRERRKGSEMLNTESVPAASKQQKYKANGEGDIHSFVGGIKALHDLSGANISYVNNLIALPSHLVALT